MAKKTLAELTKEFIEKEVQPKAERLAEVRGLLDDREERFKKETDELYHEEALLKSLLIGKLKESGLTQVKVKNGNTVAIIPSKRIEVLDEAQALVWSAKNMLVSINKTLVKSKLNEMMKANEPLPDFLRLEEGESISVKKPKPKAEESEVAKS
jgi:hypothetical protein